MTARIISAGLLVTFCLFTVRGQDKDREKPMDEWEALDISLLHAKSDRPNDGFVPNETTAVKIAEAVAMAQYGKERISRERPFHARFRDGVRTVKGTLHPTGAFGGTAVVKVSQKDAKILFVTHQE
jgi:hypothetical protein